MTHQKLKVSSKTKEDILKRLISQDNLEAKHTSPAQTASQSAPKEHESAISQALSKRVKRDIARIVFLATLSVLIIFGLYFADKETGILSQAAQKITQFLHL